MKGELHSDIEEFDSDGGEDVDDEDLLLGPAPAPSLDVDHRPLPLPLIIPAASSATRWVVSKPK